MLPEEIEIALQSIETSLETINSFVLKTSEDSTQVFQVLPSQLVLFSKTQAIAFTETSITFRRILSDVLQRCERVKEVMEKSNDRVSIALMHNHIFETGQKSATLATEKEGKRPSSTTASSHSNMNTPNVNNHINAHDLSLSGNTPPHNIHHQNTQNSIRVASESADAAEMRVMNHLFKQISENDTTAEIFSEMASVAKIFEDLRHDQDLAKIYKIRAQEVASLQQQNNRKKSPQSNAVAAPLGSKNTGESPTKNDNSAKTNQMANDLGRLTTRMKEKWELAEADRGLAEANVVALESENAVLARRVRELEERLSASSNAAAERKVLLERERARSAKLLTQHKIAAPNTPNSGRAIGTSPTSISNTPNNSGRRQQQEQQPQQNNTPNTNDAKRESVARSSSANISRATLHSAASSTGGISSIHSDDNNNNNQVSNNSGRLILGQQQQGKSVLQLNSNNNNNNNNVTHSQNHQQSGICIDGVELSEDLAKWITRVHRLLLKDPKAQEALFALEKQEQTQKSSVNNKPALRNTSPPLNNNHNNNNNATKETPFARFMREKHEKK